MKALIRILTTISALMLSIPSVRATEFQNYETEKNYSFTGGNVYSGIRSKTEPFHPQNGYDMIVGGLDASSSFLSLRTGPGSDYPEKLKLSPFNVVILTGNLSSDGRWAELKCIDVRTDSHGDVLPSYEDAFELETNSWVNTKYLYDYLTESDAFETQWGKGWNEKKEKGPCDSM